LKYYNKYSKVPLLTQINIKTGSLLRSPIFRFQRFHFNLVWSLLIKTALLYKQLFIGHQRGLIS